MKKTKTKMKKTSGPHYTTISMLVGPLPPKAIFVQLQQGHANLELSWDAHHVSRIC